MPKLRPEQVARVPSVGTLRKYGLSVREWLNILESQGGVCAICERVPNSGSWVTDHEHVAKWKKMPPERRRLYVRGIICHWCNSHVVGRFVTLEKSRNATAYLTRYNRRRPKDVPKKARKR